MHDETTRFLLDLLASLGADATPGGDGVEAAWASAPVRVSLGNGTVRCSTPLPMLADASPSRLNAITGDWLEGRVHRSEETRAEIGLYIGRDAPAPTSVGAVLDRLVGARDALQSGVAPTGPEGAPPSADRVRGLLTEAGLPFEPTATGGRLIADIGVPLLFQFDGVPGGLLLIRALDPDMPSASPAAIAALPARNAELDFGALVVPPSGVLEWRTTVPMDETSPGPDVLQAGFAAAAACAPVLVAAPDPYETFLRRCLAASGRPHELQGAGADAVAIVPTEHGGLTIDVVERALRFRLRFTSPSADPWLLDRVTRDWGFGCAFLDAGEIEVRAGLYVGSTLPDGAVVAWVIDHLSHAAGTLRSGGTLDLGAPAPPSAVLNQVEGLLADLGIRARRDEASLAFRLNHPTGRVVTQRWALVGGNLLSVLAAPEITVGWRQEPTTSAAIVDANRRLAYGQVHLEASLGLLMAQLVVCPDWATVDAELVRFLLDGAMDAAGRLVHPDEPGAKR